MKNKQQRTFGRPAPQKQTQLTAPSELVAALRAGDFETIEYNNIDVKRTEEPTITIPVGMGFEDAREWLYTIEDAQDSLVDINHPIDCIPQDGLVAFYRVLQHLYGFVEAVPTPGFFGSSLPTMVSVRTGPGQQDFVQVPWGEMRIQGLDDSENLMTAMTISNGRPRFVIGGTVRRKNEHIIAQIATMTANWVRDHSIYRGNALRLDLSWLRPDSRVRFDPDAHAPVFWDVSQVDPNQLILDPATAISLEANLFGFVRHSDAYLANGEPLNTGVVLAGKYGTGKSMAGRTLAHYAAANNWTFFYLQDPADLAAAIRLSDIYETATRGVVIYVEDIDRAMSTRTDDANIILNTLSGVDRDNRKTVVVMSTNHPEQIHTAMMRAGRTDSFIKFGYPTGDTTIRFVHQYGGSCLAPDQDYSKLAGLLTNFPPAFIESVVRRARRLAINAFGANITGRVTASQLEEAALSYQDHVRIASGQEEPVLRRDAPVILLVTDSDDEPLAQMIRRTVSNGQTKSLSDLAA